MRRGVLLFAGLLLVALQQTAAASARGAEHPPVDRYFSEPETRYVAVSPGGSLIAIHTFRDDEHAVEVRAVSGEQQLQIYSAAGSPSFGWVDDDTLILGHGEGEFATAKVVDFQLQPKLQASHHEIRTGGQVVDMLPRVPDEVLWASQDLWSSYVYRVPVTELIDPTGHPGARPGRLVHPIHRRFLVGRIHDPVVYWLCTAEGVPRAALVAESLDPLELELRYRNGPDSHWRTVGSWGDGGDFPLPVGIAEDGRDLFVLSAQGREAHALRYYDVDEEALGPVVWEEEGRDLVDVVWDQQGSAIVAVVYEEAGLRRYHYLDRRASWGREFLEHRFPDSNVSVTSRTGDRRLATVLVTGPREPGAFHLVDFDAGTATELGRAYPWLEPEQLAEVAVLRVATKDGLEIESFFTRPRRFEGARAPLVVMSHGGPIGERDTRDFDPWAQYLAASGFAVLQTNYRGSFGRGDDFMKAGRRAWGREIEDDIEAAIDRVVAEGWVDPARICAFGWSYGGYSALIGTTRRPQRYRCAAAVAAPTDLLLMFDSSDFAKTEEGRRGFAEVVGDPDRDREELLRYSPAYRAADMNVPLLLLHGQRDRRVDVDHLQRLRTMLELEGGVFEWEVIADMTHQPTKLQSGYVLDRVVRFLKANLASDPGPVARAVEPGAPDR